MNSNPYSYDQCLAILDFCVGLERHTRLTPDPGMAALLGRGIISRILEMNHAERIEFVKEVVMLI